MRRKLVDNRWMIAVLRIGSINAALWVSGFMFSAQILEGATEYDGDGVLSGRQEELRWLINRARFSPERQADALSITNTYTGGSPDYDACEDTTGTNAFGTNAASWVRWIDSKPPLAPNDVLTRAASNHSRDMAEQAIMTHYSPSSNYYTNNSSPSSRATQEGYTWSIHGENIAYGTDWWFTPEICHNMFYVDSTDADRGHRRIMIHHQYVFREIGIGYYTNGGNGYYCEDFGASGAVHFVTDTVFFDTNGDKAYQDGEGVSNITVSLYANGVQSSWYDVSQASGNFAVPIQDITDGSRVDVYLDNTNVSGVLLSIPVGYTNTGTVYIPGAGSVHLGHFMQPAGATNVGFRDLSISFSNTMFELNGSTSAVEVAGLLGAEYILQSSSNLADDASWSNITAVVSTGFSFRIEDETGSERLRFYRVVLHRDD